ncbi:unnamed protein product, partial [Rotaria magnacalcarata]
MLKVNRRRSHSRHVNSRRSIESIKSNDTETFSSEDEKILFHPGGDIDDINFSNGSVLNDISDLLTFLNKDFDEFTIDERGGKRGDSFWDCYPDLELEEKQFVYQECSKIEATFTVETLARFIDQRFYELNNLKKIDQQF